MPVIWRSGMPSRDGLAAGVVTTAVLSCLPGLSRLLRNGDVPVGDLGDQLLALGLDRGGELVTRVELDLLAAVSEPDHICRPAERATAYCRDHLRQDPVPVLERTT